MNGIVCDMIGCKKRFGSWGIPKMAFPRPHKWRNPTVVYPPFPTRVVSTIDDRNDVDQQADG